MIKILFVCHGNMCRDTMDGVYGFVDGPGKGAFPVWILTLAELEPSSDAK